MFDKLPFFLEIIGACAVVYWIICWLILVSKNDNLPEWISVIASILCGLLAVCTAPFSVVFTIPLFIIFQRTHEDVSHREYHRGLNERFSESSKQIQQSYDKGYKAASERYEKIISQRMEKVNRMHLNYISLYLKCKKDPSLSEMMNDVPEPEGLENYLKYHNADQK